MIFAYTSINGYPVRVLKDGTAKLYTTCARAEKYGQVRDAAPIDDKWIAAPFWRRDGGINSYYTEDAFLKAWNSPNFQQSKGV